MANTITYFLSVRFKKVNGPIVGRMFNKDFRFLDDMINAAMGLDLWTPIESGKIGVTASPITAALYVFNLKIKGEGGRTGYPKNAVDPISNTANIIQAIQIIQTKEMSSLKPTIIIFTKIVSGIKSNIIPDTVSLEGAMRYLYKDEEEFEKNLKE